MRQERVVKQGRVERMTKWLLARRAARVLSPDSLVVRLIRAWIVCLPADARRRPAEPIGQSADDEPRSAPGGAQRAAKLPFAKAEPG
jgi:hypothetical protein